jgi:thiosulfate/3-mercaptopyruvate sulfurtransferase
MRRAGVSSNRPVVVYDGGQGWAAARAWWLLRWTGHPNVLVLDGGLPSWQGPLQSSVPGPALAEGDFEPVPAAAGLLDADAAAALARAGVLLDARAGERYRGEVEPIDRVGGHIPGAHSAPTTDNVGPDGRFLPAEELNARFKALGATDGTEVGVYCGSGVSGAHEVLALAVAGIPAALYVGSWSEWSSDPERPVAVGPDPQ